MGGRSLARNDDGLQNSKDGFADPCALGMKNFWSAIEKPVETAHPPFRVEVAGSNPADPTTKGTSHAAAKIFKTLWALKTCDQSDGTLRAKGERLRFLAEHVDRSDSFYTLS